MSIFGLLGGVVGGAFSDQRHQESQAARLQRMLWEQRQSANLAAALRAQQYGTTQHGDESNIIDADYTVIEDPPQIEQTRLIEDKRQ